MKYHKMKTIVITLVCAVGVLAAGIMYVVQRTQHGKRTFFVKEEVTTEATAETFAKDSSEPSETTLNTEMVKVFVCGAVHNPSLYEIPADSRVYDAVQAAGGMREDANPDYVNQAARVEDGQRIYIPKMGEDLNASSGDVSGITDGKVNLNTANLDTLMTLPGIGENKAKKILEYRNKMGRFTSTEEIMNVTGIGESIYQNIRDVICIDSG